jgi:FMN phosphatase YigB (HAD superfamily)
LIRAITFDFWNTLFVAEFRASGQVRQQWIKQALQQAGYIELTDARIEQAIHRTWKEWDRVWCWPTWASARLKRNGIG